MEDGLVQIWLTSCLLMHVAYFIENGLERNHQRGNRKSTVAFKGQGILEMSVYIHVVLATLDAGRTVCLDTRWSASNAAGRCFMDFNKTGSASPLLPLLTKLVNQELRACVPTVIFDPSLPMAGARDDIFDILRDFPIPNLIGRLEEPSTPSWMPKPPAHPSNLICSVA